MSLWIHTEKQKMNIFIFSCIIWIILFFWLAEDIFGLSWDDLLIWFLGILFASGLIIGVLWYIIWRFSFPRNTKILPDTKKLLLNIWRSKVEFPILMYGGQYENEIHFYDSLDSIVELGEWMVWAEHIIDSNLKIFTLSQRLFEDKYYYFKYEVPHQWSDISLEWVKDLFKDSIGNIVEELVETGHQTWRYYYWIMDQIERASSLERIVWLLKDVY